MYEIGDIVYLIPSTTLQEMRGKPLKIQEIVANMAGGIHSYKLQKLCGDTITCCTFSPKALMPASEYQLLMATKGIQ